MKKIFYSFAILSLVMTGCQKNFQKEETPGNDPVLSGEPTTVTFSLRSSATKADPATEDGTLNENKVNRVDAFVFNADGTLDGYVKVDNPGNINQAAEVKATTGKGKRFIVLVNAAGKDSQGNIDAKFTDDLMESVDHINDLNNVERTFYLRNNTRDGFQMYGNATKDLISGVNTVTVPINRAVSRIKIDKITRQFDVPSLQQQTFKITKIYVSNVVGTVRNVADADDGSNDGKYFQTIMAGADNDWFNKYAVESDHTNHPYDGYIALTADVNVKNLTEINIANDKQTIAQGETLTIDTPVEGHTDGFRLYVMPNNVMPAYPETLPTDPAKTWLDYEQALQSPNPWAPSLTKLVIETELAGKTYYYAIPIVHRTTYPEGKISSGIGYNETFNFKNIVLTRAGSEDPDTPVSTADVTFDLDIKPWTVQAMATEGDGDDFKI